MMLFGLLTKWKLLIIWGIKFVSLIFKTADMAKANTYNKKNTASVHLTGLELGKKPPQAIDLEEAILGATMLEKDVIFSVQELLKPESFYRTRIRRFTGRFRNCRRDIIPSIFIPYRKN